MTKVLLLVVVVVVAVVVDGHPWYQSAIPNGGAVEYQGGLWAGVGHLLRGGSGENNQFGLDFIAAGFTWTQTLCLADSDGDGRSNGEELGDPTCVWSPGQTPARTTYITHPALADDPNDLCYAGSSVEAQRCNWTQIAAAQKEDLRINPFTIPSTQTDTYVCAYFVVPSDRKYHVIRFEPIVDQVLNVHHQLLFTCAVAQSNYGVAQQCGMPTCTRLIYAWGFGGTGSCLPSDAGLAIGYSANDTSVTPWIAIQIHYNNAALNSSIPPDTSGMRLYITPTLRRFDSSVMMFGYASGPVIPAGITFPPFEVVDGCPGACTNLLGGAGLWIYGAQLHMHKVGVQIATKHLNASGMPANPSMGAWGGYFAANKYWDFNVQMYIPILQRQLRPGDSADLTCYYVSSNQQSPVPFGETTTDEMCLGFLYYYPKTNPAVDSSCHSDASTVAYCKSVPSGVLPGISPSYQPNEEVACPYSPRSPAFECMWDWDCPHYNTGNQICNASRVCQCVGGSTPPNCVGSNVFPTTTVQPGEFTYSGQLFGGTMTFYWKVEIGNAANASLGPNYLDGALVLHGVGWVGFGIGATMFDADTTQGAVGSSGATVQDGYASAQAAPTPDVALGGTDDITAYTASVANGVVTVKFRKRLQSTATDKDINYNGATACIFAYQQTSPDFAVQHTTSAPYDIDFFTGTVALRKVWEPIDTHAVLMVLAWLFLVPGGIVVAMACKHWGHAWYLVHLGLQGVAAIFVLAAFILAVQYSGSHHFLNNALSPTHACLGLATVLIMFLQPALGLYANHVYDANRERAPVFPDGVHKALGRIALILAWFAMCYGLQARGVNLYTGTVNGWIAAVSVVFFAVIIIITAVYFRQQNNGGGRGGGAGKAVEME